MTSYPSPSNLPAGIPNIQLNITSVPVTAKPRRLKSQWSKQAVDDFLSDWGTPVWPRLPDNVLDIVKDALEDPNYDPDSPEPYKGLWRWEDGRIATPEEVKKAHPEVSLVERMADEMKSEIDREIAKELLAFALKTSTSRHPELADQITEPESELPTWLANTIELTPAGRAVKDAAAAIWADGLARIKNPA